MDTATFLWALGAAFMWFLLGCLVMSSMDAADGGADWFKWASGAPFGLYVPTVVVWPLWLALWLAHRANRS